MSSRLLSRTCLGLTAALVAVPLAAQEQAKPQMFTVHEDVVKPGMAAQYDATAKKFRDMVVQQDASLSWVVAMGNDFTYVYLTPIENMAGIDKVNAAFGAVREKAGAEVFDGTMKGFAGTYDTHRNYVITLRPELSYNSSLDADAAAGKNFRHWDYYYVKPDMWAEAMQVARDWRELYASKKVPDGYRIYTGGFGTEPVIVVVQSGKNAADFYARNDATTKLLGDVGPLLARTWAVTQRFEQRDGWMRPDLGTAPMASPATK